MVATAATASAQGVGVGIKGGPVFASFNADNLDFDKRTGLQAGIFFGGNRPGTIGVMGEVNFIQKKAEGLKLNYIQVPVLLRINGGSKSRGGVNVYGLIGPAVDIRISDEIDGIGNIDDAVENVDLGVIGGVGVEITRFILEGRYTWGLRQINKASFDTTEIKTRTFAILFGVRFN